MKQSLPYERLEVYRVALELLGVSDKIASSLPAAQEYLATQLWELAMAVPVQIARATGQSSPRERKEVLGLARGTAAKSAAILDLIDVIELGDAEQLARAGSLIEHLVTGLDLLTRNDLPRELLDFDYESLAETAAE